MQDWPFDFSWPFDFFDFFLEIKKFSCFSVSAVSGSSCCVSGCSQDGGSAVAQLNTVHSWQLLFQHNAAMVFLCVFDVFFASNQKVTYSPVVQFCCSGQLSCTNPSTGEVTRQDLSSDLMFDVIVL